MPRSLSSNPLVLLAAGFVVVATLAYVSGRDPAPPSWSPVENVAIPTPSAENVDPGFHARLMTLRDRLAASPDDTTALLEAARLEQDAHQLEAAADHYERLLALVPDRHQAWLDLANVYAGLGQWDEARAASERMLARFPGDASARYNLGAIAANGGDLPAAREHWTAVRDGDDSALAAQAIASLAQLDGRSAPRAPGNTDAQRNPHASLGQPVTARRVTTLD